MRSVCVVLSLVLVLLVTPAVAADLPESAAAVVCATQKPVHNSVFAATIGTPAWKTIPSWYLVSTEDHAIPPATEWFMARRAQAHIESVGDRCEAIGRDVGHEAHHVRQCYA